MSFFIKNLALYTKHTIINWYLYLYRNMTETVLSFFDNSWVPATWLTPSIQGISITGSTLFSWVMTEVSWWRYSYEITNYNKGIKYLITVDWWATMWASRYQYVTNELDSYENKPDRKWQRAWSGQMNIDASLIAKEVWKVSAENPIEWTYGAVVQKEMKAIDFDPILKAIKDIPKWVTIKDIKEILPEYDDSKVLESIKIVNQSIKDIVIPEYEEKEEEDTITPILENIIEKLENTDVLNKIDKLSDILSIYSWMLDKIKEKESDFTYIKLWVDDILSKLK